MIDTSTPAGARAAERLGRDMIGWLTTVSPEGQPQASPVWFVWEEGGQEGEILVFSQPRARRLVNLRSNPHVAFNLESENDGGHVVSLEGEARVVPGAPLVQELPAYVAKYGRAIAAMGSTPEGMGADYSAAVRIRITRVRSW
jgi:PPOX class probable F420-dependent enzyme